MTPARKRKKDGLNIDTKTEELLRTPTPKASSRPTAKSPWWNAFLESPLVNVDANHGVSSPVRGRFSPGRSPRPSPMIKLGSPSFRLFERPSTSILPSPAKHPRELALPQIPMDPEVSDSPKSPSKHEASSTPTVSTASTPADGSSSATVTPERKRPSPFTFMRAEASSAFGPPLSSSRSQLTSFHIRGTTETSSSRPSCMHRLVFSPENHSRSRLLPRNEKREHFESIDSIDQLPMSPLRPVGTIGRISVGAYGAAPEDPHPEISAARNLLNLESSKGSTSQLASTTSPSRMETDGADSLEPSSPCADDFSGDGSDEDEDDDEEQDEDQDQDQDQDQEEEDQQEPELKVPIHKRRKLFEASSPAPVPPKPSPTGSDAAPMNATGSGATDKARSDATTPNAPSKPKPKRTASKSDCKRCKCKKSKCLKLYCECFQVQGYCSKECKCVGCNNVPEFEDVRQKAIQATLERDSRAFFRVHKSGHSPKETKETTKNGSKVSHPKGCHCKKSQCLKKYCECYQAGVSCGDNCKCIDCKNGGAPNQDASTSSRKKSKVKGALFPDPPMPASISGMSQTQFSASGTVSGNLKQSQFTSGNIAPSPVIA